MKNKIELLTYDEYLKYQHLYKNVINRDVFENYQKRDKAPIKFFKIRIRFDIIYFSLTEEYLTIINKNIYNKNIDEIINFFEEVRNLGIIKKGFFYDTCLNSYKGTLEDYIDNLESKENFIKKYEKFFSKKLFSKIFIFNNDKVANDEELEYELQYLEKINLYKIKYEKYVLFYNQIDENSIMLREVMINDLDDKTKKAYFKIISKLTRKFKKIYILVDYNLKDEKCCRDLGFELFKEIYGYYL